MGKVLRILPRLTGSDNRRPADKNEQRLMRVQPNHVLKEQLEAALAEVCEMHCGGRGTPMPAMIGSIDVRPSRVQSGGRHGLFPAGADDALYAQPLLSTTMQTPSQAGRSTPLGGELFSATTPVFLGSSWKRS